MTGSAGQGAGDAVPTLTTPRLLLRPLCPADAPAIQVAFPHWPVVRFLAARVPWPYPADGAARFVEASLDAIAAGTEWHWSIRPRATDDPDQDAPLIGIISLMDHPDNNRGFWLAPDWQGRGLMTEACLAVTGFWFDALGRTVLRAPKAVANVRSRRMSERTGMRLVGTEMRDYVSGRQPAEIWEITAEEWRRRAGGSTE